MIRTLTFRAILLALAVTPAAFAHERVSYIVREPLAMDAVSDVKPGAPIKGSCDDGSACVAIPVAVEGRDETGEPRTVVTNYTLGSDLVEQVKSDFNESATAVLRHLREPLVNGLHSADAEVQQTCRQAIGQVDGSVHYKVQPQIAIPLHIEKTVAQIAERTFEKGVRPIVVTSAARTPLSQADAMRVKIAGGDNIVRLYANKQAAGEVLQAYKHAKHLGLGVEGVNQEIAQAIQSQVDRGIFISNHLREGAVDIRIRDLSSTERHDLIASAQETEGVHKTILESIPPHLHIEVE